MQTYSDDGVKKVVGKYCRTFRMEVFGSTLRSMVGVSRVKALSAFEHGRSSNMLLLLEYMREASRQDCLLVFTHGLDNVIAEYEKGCVE